MASKTVPISARISHEDAEFLSQLKINGATTPSDKLRAIITDARIKSAQKHDYLGYLNIMQEFISPVNNTLKGAEHSQQIHSELVLRMLDWLPEAFAYLVSAETDTDNGVSTDMLTQLEEGLANRIFRLIESILQMGVTSRCPCYNKKVIADRIEPVLELANVINLSHKTKGK